jgi:FkbM family methyltransferase
VFNPVSIAKSLRLDICGVVQVGAHIGQEIDEFVRTYGAIKIVAFEPCEDNYEVLTRKFGNNANVTLIQKALGAKDLNSQEFFIASNRGQSSSLLKPKEHLRYDPRVRFTGIKTVDVCKLDNYRSEFGDCNFLIVDTQGYELEVLRGALQTLCNIDYVFIEVNKGEVYENCAKFDEINALLEERNFYCSHIRWFSGVPWGDALYIKRHCLTSKNQL